jgi:hypothetical protein
MSWKGSVGVEKAAGKSRGRISAILLGAMASLSMAAHASAPPKGTGDKVGLQIDDFIGTVRIVRSDVNSINVVTVNEGASGIGPVVVEETGSSVLRVRGMPAPLAMNCVRLNGALSISFDDGPAQPITDFPTIVISVPPSADVKLMLRAGDAEVSETENLEILAGGCANIVAERVTNTLRLTTTGAARFSVDQARRADIDASNGGQIRISNVDRLLSACLGHASKLNSDKVTGDARMYMSGTSRATLSQVDLNELTAELDGTSSLDVTGTASTSRIAVGAAARAHVTGGVKLGDVSLTRAGRLVVDGKRWKGP